jgi:hypothetical protein
LKIPPKTHDLVKLSQATSLKLSEEQIMFLDKINSFQLEARYPDYKVNFISFVPINLPKEI